MLVLALLRCERTPALLRSSVHSLAAGALVGHGPQHHQVAQRGQQEAEIEGAGGVVGQRIRVRLLLHTSALQTAVATAAGGRESACACAPRGRPGRPRLPSPATN